MFFVQRQENKSTLLANITAVWLKHHPAGWLAETPTCHKSRANNTLNTFDLDDLYPGLISTITNWLFLLKLNMNTVFVSVCRVLNQFYTRYSLLNLRQQSWKCSWISRSRLWETFLTCWGILEFLTRPHFGFRAPREVTAMNIHQAVSSIPTCDFLTNAHMGYQSKDDWGETRHGVDW